MFVVLLGLPGAGKGTQAALLKEELGLPHVTTGDLFRENIGNDTELGRKAKGFMDAGQLVPDELVLDMLFDHVAKPACAGGYILDGFPRTLPQAEALTGEWTAQMVGEVRAAVPVEGLAAQIDGRLLISVAREVVDLSKAGLRARGLTNAEGDDESLYLEPLFEAVASGMTPAEQLLQNYYGPWNRDINRLSEESAF